MYDDYPWFVTTDRALSVDATGGCWVELTRLVELDTGSVVEQLDCGFYGPVDPSSDPLADLSDEEYELATCPA